MERNAFLINKKIHQYILPGMLMTVAMQLGNVVDGMIVGNLLGAEAMAAIEISMPVLLLLQMAALMLAPRSFGVVVKITLHPLTTASSIAFNPNSSELILS